MDTEETQLMFFCKLCSGHVFHSNEALLQHLLLTHDTHRMVCLFCERHFYSQEELDSHIEVHESQQEGYINCPHCNFLCLSNITSVEHATKHCIKPLIFGKTDATPIFVENNYKNGFSLLPILCQFKVNRNYKETFICQRCNKQCDSILDFLTHREVDKCVAATDNDNFEEIKESADNADETNVNLMENISDNCSEPNDKEFNGTEEYLENSDAVSMAESIEYLDESLDIDSLETKFNESMSDNYEKQYDSSKIPCSSPKDVEDDPIAEFLKLPNKNISSECSNTRNLLKKNKPSSSAVQPARASKRKRLVDEVAQSDYDKEQIYLKEVKTLEMLSCDICKQLFSSQHFLNHHKEVHRKYVASNKYFCRFCTYKRFPKVTALLEHVAQIHKTAKLFKCYVCSQDFGKQMYFSNHIKEVHDNVNGKFRFDNKTGFVFYNIKDESTNGNNKSNSNNIDQNKNTSISFNLNIQNSTSTIDRDDQPTDLDVSIDCNATLNVDNNFSATNVIVISGISDNTVDNNSVATIQAVADNSVSPIQIVDDHSGTSIQAVDNNSAPPLQDIVNNSAAPIQIVDDHSGTSIQAVDNHSDTSILAVDNNSAAPLQDIVNNCAAPIEIVGNHSDTSIQGVDNRPDTSIQAVDNNSPAPIQDIVNNSAAPIQIVGNYSDTSIQAVQDSVTINSFKDKSITAADSYSTVHDPLEDSSTLCDMPSVVSEAQIDSENVALLDDMDQGPLRPIEEIFLREASVVLEDVVEKYSQKSSKLKRSDRLRMKHLSKLKKKNQKPARKSMRNKNIRGDSPKHDVILKKTLSNVIIKVKSVDELNSIDTPTVSKQKSKLKCHFCSKRLKDELAFHLHIKNHFQDDSFLCMCGVRLPTKESFEEHKRKYHMRNDNADIILIKLNEESFVFVQQCNTATIQGTLKKVDSYSQNTLKFTKIPDNTEDMGKAILTRLDHNKQGSLSQNKPPEKTGIFIRKIPPEELDYKKTSTIKMTGVGEGIKPANGRFALTSTWVSPESWSNFYNGVTHVTKLTSAEVSNSKFELHSDTYTMPTVPPGDEQYISKTQNLTSASMNGQKSSKSVMLVETNPLAHLIATQSSFRIPSKVTTNKNKKTKEFDYEAIIKNKLSKLLSTKAVKQK